MATLPAVSGCTSKGRSRGPRYGWEQLGHLFGDQHWDMLDNKNGVSGKLPAQADV